MKSFETQEEMVAELKMQVANHMSEVMTEKGIESCIIVTDLQGKGVSVAAIGSARSISMSVKTMGILDRKHMTWWGKIFLGVWLIVTCFA